MSSFDRKQSVRKRKEYLFRKAEEHKFAQMQARKSSVKRALDNETTLRADLRKDAYKLMDSARWDDAGPSVASNMGNMEGALGIEDEIDNEYRHAGVEDPKIFLTTSHDPSSRLKMFAKEMKLIFPNCERLNRGNLDLKTLISGAKANGFTDAVILHETRGKPDHMVISHLPNGPTAYFTLYDVILRHDTPDVGTMSIAYPHLYFHNFNTRLGKRIVSVLKYLFPVPKDDSKRLLAFLNHSDYIIFKHVTADKGDGGKIVGTTEVGPRFMMQCHKIIRGTLENEKASDVEFVVKPYMNTAHKKLLLSNEMPWSDDENDEDEPELDNTDKRSKNRDIAQ